MERLAGGRGLPPGPLRSLAAARGLASRAFPTTLLRLRRCAPAPPEPTQGPRARAQAMKINIRKSTAKHAKKTGYRTRQKSKGGRKVNRRQRRRHGSF